MLKLATVFSGIGAIEFALRRLNINHEIVFACDNGDVGIDINTDDQMKYIRGMSTFEEKNSYVKALYSRLSRKTNFVIKTYLNNYDLNDNRFFYDAKLLDGTDFTDQIDLFVGGSPCQSFSIAGARGGFEDTRGTLFYDFIRLVKEIQPRVFIYENVFGVLTHDKGNTWATMQNVFSEINYHCDWRILDSRDYGIPQGRRRIFVIGFRSENQFDRFRFPEAVRLKYTMQDFLLDNCAEGDFTFDSRGDIVIKKGGQKVERYLSDKLIAYVMSPGTKNFYHENAEINLPVARAILSTQGNTHRASVNNYVTTNGRIRALEPRESLRLMGFTDDFKITVSRAQSFRQSGNSIVVDVLMALIKSIGETL